MRYKNLVWIFVIGGILLVWIIVTSPDAGTAGERSSGLFAFFFGSLIAWGILETFPDKKKPEG